MKKKKDDNLAYMSLGFARPYDLENKIDEIIPVDDQKNRVFKAMVNKSICGISALASLGNSTLEWNQHIKEMLDTIPVLVRIENPLVIIGESGTGKESMAEVLHFIANGDAKPFISVNCSAIPKDMLESELFGHEKGAFTGATALRKGMIESAKKGSIFLDELGKMEKNLQHKLLRVIEEHKVRRLGSEKDISIDDVKFIISLQPKDVKDKTIAVDLLNRLNIYTAIKLPPLKERLRADPNIVHDVLEKLQKNMALMNNDEKQKVEVLAEKVKEAYEKYDESLKKVHIKIIKPERKREYGLTEAALGYAINSEGVSLLDNTILPDQRMWTKKSEQAWKEYIKYQVALSKLQSPVRLSPEANVVIVTYDGYDDKNFRELENILKAALLKAHIAGRKEILLEDLHEEVRNPSAKIILSFKTEETNASVFDETINVPLKEIINYADERKKSIVRNKISFIRKRGQNIKSTLKLEGALNKESDYTGFYNKFKRILGKEFMK